MITEAWYSSLSWLRENSPEPFGDPDFFYASYPPKRDFEYPESAYGVMSWWDYGYWITYVAHRPPTCHPGSSPRKLAATFLLSQEEDVADTIMRKRGADYVVIDYLMTTSKFYALPQWADQDYSDFCGVYQVRDNAGDLQPVLFYYPGYYRSTVVRLYNFDGEAVGPGEGAVEVISWKQKTDDKGEPYREIVGYEAFDSYEEAESHLSKQESGNYRIGSHDPFASPITLPSLEHYRLIHGSEDMTLGHPSVKIFEYVP